MPARNWFAGAAVVLILGCSAPPARQPPAAPQVEWPSGAPPKPYYARLYENDDANRRVQTATEYYRWVIRFYEGWPMFPAGWRDTETQLLEGVNDERYPIIKAKLSYLGHLVSGEWAKDNGVRRIHSSMLMVWGQLLREAHEDAEKERIIDHVTDDVLALLSGTLDTDVIGLERYQGSSKHGAVTEPVRSKARIIDGVAAPDG